ncbi:MAG: 50S ribosomal protein L13 [Chloroflexi bacterium]|nr:50S ribosomal protein L13 [Chloroflexota bacterium]
MKRTKTYNAKPDEVGGDWQVVDAAGVPMGRLAVEVARILQGKGRPTYTPYVITGDYVIVVNAAKVGLTGSKVADKVYYRHSGYPSGLKQTSYRGMMDKHPDYAIKHAVKGMLPKNNLAIHMLKRLKVYAGPDHPHQAQVTGSRKKAVKE